MKKFTDILLGWVEEAASILYGSIGLLPLTILKRLINAIWVSQPVHDEVTISIKGLNTRTAHLDLTLSGDGRRVEDKE